MSVRRCAVMEKKYIFEYDVGQWTFGTIQVYKERDTGNLKTCKIVRKSILQFTSDVLTRLKALQELQHPHICSITDVLEDRDSFYVVMDFFQGGDVQDWMERFDEGQWLQESACAGYVRQAILALTHSHAAQVFHRDLRPSNLLLTSKLPDAMVKVSDFGLAAVLDPDNTIMQKEPSPFAMPEALQAADRSGAAADIWSIGAIAHAMLLGVPPSGSFGRSESSGWGLARKVCHVEEEAWLGRSPYSRDFVRRCLRQRGSRATPAQLLWHPWLKALTPLSGANFRADNEVARDLRHRALCYMLAVVLLPVVVPHKDFEQLRVAFEQLDTDQDGLIPRVVCQRLLLQRKNFFDAVIPALGIVDVLKTDVLDLCATACADLVVRDYFAAGPTHSPLCGPFRATDLAPRMLKKFFETFSERKNGAAQAVVHASHIKAKLRTATAREMEVHTSVRYEDLLSCLPEDRPIDSQLLTTQLIASAGRGTPIGADTDLSPQPEETPWGIVAGSPFNLDMSSIFYSCGVGAARRDESPHSIRIF